MLACRPIVPALALFVLLLAQCPARAAGPKLLAKGWVQAAGEIRVYRHRADLGRLYDGSCISGVMTRGRALQINCRTTTLRFIDSGSQRQPLSEWLTIQLESIGVENDQR